MSKVTKTPRSTKGKKRSVNEDNEQPAVPSKAFLAALDAVSRMKGRTPKKL